MPGFSFSWIPTALLVIGGGVFAWTGFYTVPAEAEGVVLRFGRFHRTEQPGLHFKLPLGIDESRLVPVKRQLKQEFGFATQNATATLQATEPNEQHEEKSMVTGDLNAAFVEWVIQYRIEDPKHYLFSLRNPDATLRDASESVMREVVGDRTVDEVITIGRQEVEDEALRKLREVTSSYAMGIKVDQVQLKNVNPPDKVQASFNEVNQAQQEKERAINVANGEYNKEIPRARGRATQTIRAAEGYAQQRVNEAQGEAAAFTALLTEYTKAPEVTRKRLYLETMADVLSKVKHKVIVGEEVKGLLPMLNVNGQAGGAK